LLPKNHLFGGSLLSNLASVKNGSLVVFEITREGFIKVFETREQNGYVAAYQAVGNPGSGGKKVHVALVADHGGFLGSKKVTTMFTYDW
jgi:hypothetical protein